MQTSLEEDILESILVIQQGGVAATVEKIASHLSVAEDTIIPALEKCKGRALLTGDVASEWHFTPEGKRTAEKVARKHAVLSCFLSEKLGLEAEAASREACILEHGVSEETIEALDSYLQTTGRGCSRGHGRRNCDHLSASSPLVTFPEGATVFVTFIRCPGRHRRLIDLGIIEGEPITIRRKLHNDAVVITVKGCDIALSPEVASEIHVRRQE
ncbi:MAG: metal-dependent transcriptional regulator [Methanocalculus sp.]|uniref:metal-dependent transcriptional regulator n=1 Tax=Methanocalculus sp. TaxID=2004547 RepID=UPI0027217F01|nr:metal-dependent transcriptional regulator [Methanocalculus sp.]MDO9539997.1 metal-dependent transcriptional regulator [Methanocalculus sp.]